MKNAAFALALSFAGAFLAGCASPRVPAEPAPDTLIAHRGESRDAPENTLPAYRMAVERGFGFECDVYLSSDNRVFSFHDANLRRTTGVDVPCAKASWRDLVSKIDAGSWKGAQWKGVRPALLEEILELARDGRQIYVEIKAGTNIVPHVKAVFAKQSNATPKNTLFICFSEAVCAALKRQMPAYKVYWLTNAHAYTRGKDGRYVKGDAKSPSGIIEVLERVHADGVDIAFDPEVVTETFVAKIENAGFEVHVWTVDNLDRTLQAFANGARTVTTNCAKRQLDEYRARGRREE